MSGVLKFVRRLARRSVRNFFYRFMYVRENAFSKKIQPFLKRVRVLKIKSQEQWDSQYRRGVWNYLYELREQAHYAVLLTYVVHLRPMSSVLDVGCGEGLLHRWLRPFGYTHYTGIDLSEVAIASCAPHCGERTSFIVANAETYVPERIFDVIVFGDSLYYLSEPAKVIERYGSYLAKDGILVVSLRQGARAEAIRRFLKSTLALIDETVVSDSTGKSFCLAFKAPAHDVSHKQNSVKRCSSVSTL